MFRTAAKKIAHNSTIPALAGNKDLRTLQDLITAEKSVLNSLQKLSVDIAKASEALKAWGMGEGDDLGDILSASSALYLHFSAALSAFSTHELSVREQMKSVRTREESLDALRRRRKSLASDAESAERKLSKMNPDHKNLQAQTDLLNKLREDIRVMDTEIMAEEASLGDFKRSSAKTWMGLKFGGLVECCEKGAIVGELGKVVITEIPIDPTEPGLPRAYYQGHAQTEALVVEARRAVNEIIFSADPNPSSSPRHLQFSPGSMPGPLSPTSQRRQSGLNQYSSYGDGSRRASLSMSMQMPVPVDDPDMLKGNGIRSPSIPSFSGYGHLSRQSFSSDQVQPPAVPNAGNMNEFGTIPLGQFSLQTSSLRGSEERERVAGPRGRFATFPTKAAGPRPPPGASAGASSYGALPLQEHDRPPSLDVEQPQDSFSSSVAQALGQQFELSEGAQGSSTLSAPSTDPLDRKRRSIDSELRSYSPPPPVYSPPTEPLQFDLRDDEDEGADVQLAYMSSHANDSDASLSQRDRADRRVRFDGSPDVIPEAGNAGHGANNDEGPDHDSSRQESRDPEGSQSQASNEGPQPSAIKSPVIQSVPESEERSSSPVQIRSPPPRTQSPVSDEKSLNAAAAREVSRELDALMFSSPSLSPDTGMPEPLLPPQAPFSKRSVSPRPNVEISTTQPMSPRIEPQYLRERDRALVSPNSISSVSSGDTSRVSGDRSVPSPAPPPMANVSVALPSPSPSGISNVITYRTPPEHASPSGTIPASSLYNLPSSVTGSGASFSSTSVSGGSRTISAAAFRRPQIRAPSSPMPDSGVAGLPDTGPLNVKKRPLPTSPFPSSRPQGVSSQGRIPSAPMTSGGAQDVSAMPYSRYRSVSATHPQDGNDPRTSSRVSTNSGRSPTRNGDGGGGSDDDFDYISAYVNSTDTATRPEDESHPQSSGYEQGRFATNLENDGTLEGLR
ncbi:hypothetical protein AcV7_005370 [Taiwanofungus camphoratus]|nr:hypothetical protein AcV7_005370 [Antrodia cinnamomea]